VAKVIAFANQKGGVGKTTSCVNTAASLSALQRRVLLIDLDPQGNATMGSGIDKFTLNASMNEILQGEAYVHDAMQETEAGFYLLGANGDLTAAEVALLKKPKQEQQLKNALKPVQAEFDYILIDCPPSLNMLTLNALVAAGSVIIPMQCEYYALEGLSALVDTIEQIRGTLNEKLEIEGIVRTMFDSRNRLSIDVSKQLIEHFGKKVYKTIVPRNIRLAEAPSYGIPILLYDKNSKGAESYIGLAKEIIKKEPNVKKKKESIFNIFNSKAKKELVS